MIFYYSKRKNYSKEKITTPLCKYYVSVNNSTTNVILNYKKKKNWNFL